MQCFYDFQPVIALLLEIQFRFFYIVAAFTLDIPAGLTLMSQETCCAIVSSTLHLSL